MVGLNIYFETIVLKYNIILLKIKTKNIQDEIYKNHMIEIYKNHMIIIYLYL